MRIQQLPCEYNPVSSRTCEMGTNGCNVIHDVPAFAKQPTERSWYRELAAYPEPEPGDYCELFDESLPNGPVVFRRADGSFVSMMTMEAYLAMTDRPSALEALRAAAGVVKGLLADAVEDERALYDGDVEDPKVKK